jgi:hypothetical protein
VEIDAAHHGAAKCPQDVSREAKRSRCSEPLSQRDIPGRKAAFDLGPNSPSLYYSVFLVELRADYQVISGDDF